MNSIFTLQILISVIFFANKVFVLAGRRFGWLLGAIAASLGIAYFYAIELYVYTALEFGLIALMGYAFWPGASKSVRVEQAINLITVLAMLTLCWFAFNGFLTVCELASSVCLLLGTHRLSHDAPRSGWLAYTLAHGFAAYVGYGKGQWFFADMQIASAIVSVAGFTKKEY